MLSPSLQAFNSFVNRRQRLCSKKCKKRGSPVERLIYSSQPEVKVANHRICPRWDTCKGDPEDFQECKEEETVSSESKGNPWCSGQTTFQNYSFSNFLFGPSQMNAILSSLLTIETDYI